MPESSRNTFLHVGCGELTKASIYGFDSPDWREIRLDIDPGVKPDIVASITDMGVVETNSMDAVFSSHNIEHLFAHEVPLALGEFFRVLKQDGFLVVTCPDLRATCEAIIRSGPTEPIFDSRAGPIAPLDVLYGHRASIAKGQHYMAHRGGFTLKSLGAELESAGFKTLHGGRRPMVYDLWALAFKSHTPDARCQELAAKFLPQ